MTKPRFSPKRQPHKTVVPFRDAQEAWFWFMRTEKARLQGARPREEASNEMRPCDADDIYRVVMALHRGKRIGAAHLKVLAEYGWRESPPDARLGEERWALGMWDEALDRLTGPLKSRGIVFHEDGHVQPV